MEPKGIGATTLGSYVSISIATGFAGGSIAPGVGNLIGAVDGLIAGIGFYYFTELAEYDGLSLKELVDSLM